VYGGDRTEKRAPSGSDNAAAVWRVPRGRASAPTCRKNKFDPLLGRSFRNSNRCGGTLALLQRLPRPKVRERDNSIGSAYNANVHCYGAYSPSGRHSVFFRQRRNWAHDEPSISRLQLSIRLSWAGLCPGRILRHRRWPVHEIVRARASRLRSRVVFLLRLESART